MVPILGTIGLGALFLIACQSMASMGTVAVSFAFSHLYCTGYLSLGSQPDI